MRPQTSSAAWRAQQLRIKDMSPQAAAPSFHRMPATSLPRLTRAPAAMSAVDSIEWNADLTVRAYGRTIGVRVNDPKVLDLIPKHLPYGWRPAVSHAAERMYSVFTSG